MILMKRSSSDNYRIVFFLIISVFLHAIVYLIADAASLFSPAPRRAKTESPTGASKGSGVVKNNEVKSSVYDNSSDNDSYGDAPSLDSGAAVISSEINKLKSAVKTLRVVLARQSHLEEAKEMFALYEATLIWLEWFLDKVSVFLVKLNI